MRIKLTIAYDGAPFAGWQSQAGGNAVQDVIEKAIARITGEAIRLHGAGRTDAGVHALGQVAHFDVPESSRLAPADWFRALNGTLPASVRVLRAAKTSEDFHARFSAKGKVYRYDLWSSHVLLPHLHRRAWHVHPPPDETQLRDALQVFVGKHDFRAFAANRRTPVGDTVRHISSIRASRSGPRWQLTFEGDGFLYKMVRMLAGAAVRVSTGRQKIQTQRHLLAHPETGRWTHVAPADGLHLVRVRYG